jgi:hypothetical protein
MSHSGHYFAPPARGQVSENQVNKGAANIGKRIAIEKEKGSQSMAPPKEFYDFAEG